MRTMDSILKNIIKKLIRYQKISLLHTCITKMCDLEFISWKGEMT